MYDRIFNTQSKRSQFMKKINAQSIEDYYSKRQSDSKGTHRENYHTVLDRQ